jgi:CelD/BcsL family acetyltransferase involved in cellulose biosynthesis
VTPVEWFVASQADDLLGLEPEWRALAESLAEPSLFATPEWNRVWWSHFGQNRTLHLVGARVDGRLAALAPLCTRTVLGGIRIRQWLGSEEADRGGLLLAPGAESLAGDLLRRALGDPGWDLADLWCVPAGDATGSAWRTIVEGGGLHHHHESLLCQNPVLDLRTDEWTEGVRREQLGRKRRALGRQGEVRVTFPKDADAVEAALTDLQTLHAKRWREAGEISRLTLPGYWAWVRGIAREASDRGWLYLPRLEADGRLVATGLFVLYRRRLFQWINGHALEFHRHSPFLLLQHAVIEHLRTGDVADVLDFGRGDEWYKSRWTRRAVPLERLMAWRGLRGRGAYVWTGHVRPWAWAHQTWSRPIRRLKRSLPRPDAGAA